MTKRWQERHPSVADLELDEDERRIIEQRKALEAIQIKIALLSKNDPELSKNATRKKIREYWKRTSELLRQMSLWHLDVGGPIAHDIGGMLFRMHTLAEDLGDGQISPWIEAARNTGGGKGSTRFERELISMAIFFLEGVDDGSITCDRPTSYVAEEYNVTRKTVRNWKAKRDIYAAGQIKPHPNLIEESMRYAAVKYRAFGRGGHGQTNS